ncbi:MAG: ABC transporter ATP-binding protein [Catenibacillus sp.]
MIEVKNLVKKYGDHLAVDHLTFTVEKGQIYGFLGPNGAGKSTTMNIMTGYIGATEGAVIIDGHDILKEPEAAKKCIGYLPEIPPVYPDMTVEEYLKFSAELKGIKKEKRAAHIGEIMERTKVVDVRNRLIKNLSKGYRQRVGLANAIMGYPPIIILDEPTVGLDPKQIIEIRELIKNLAREHTIILSSHILTEISEVCDYVMIIAHGQLIAADTTDNLTKLMMGQNMYHILVRGDMAGIREALGNVEGMKIKDIAVSSDPEVCELRIESCTEKGDAGDFREPLFFTLAKAGYPILVQPEHASLEDIFLELTREQTPVNSKKSRRRFKIRGNVSDIENKEDEDDDSDL